MKIRERHRYTASPKAGFDTEWIEFQVVDGRKIIGRFDLREQAEAFVAESENQ